MLRYDMFYLAGALVASPVLAARLLRTGKWRTDWRGRFGYVAPDVLPGGGATGEPSRRIPTGPDSDPVSEILPTAGDGPGHRSPVWSRGHVEAGDPDSRDDPEIPGATPHRPTTPPPRALPTVLVHGVSVGEVAATRELVERLSARARVVVSATTDTGVSRARSLYGACHAVVRYPFDLSRAVRRFLDAVRPDVVALTELEVWPNFVTECARRGVPVCVVNGRLSSSSYRGYRRARRWLRPVFGRLAAVGAQNEVYARRFVDLGVPPARVEITDTMKWDTSGRPALVRVATDHPSSGGPASGPAASGRLPGSPAEALAAALGIDRARPLIVAGSTGPGEETELIATRPPSAQLLLVPRKPERFDAVAALHRGMRRRSRCGGPAAATSPAALAPAATPAPDDAPAAPNPVAAPPPSDTRAAPAPVPAPRAVPYPTDLYLLDTMGELELAYALADVAIVGRSFAPMGGSDPIPPVAAGCPTIIGPHHEHFAEVVSALREDGGLVVTNSPMAAAARLLEDPEGGRRMTERGQQVIEERRGASARSAELVLGQLKAPAA